MKKKIAKAIWTEKDDALRLITSNSSQARHWLIEHNISYDKEILEYTVRRAAAELGVLPERPSEEERNSS